VSDDKVIGLDGKPAVIPEFNVRPEVVRLLETLLAEAKAGRLCSLLACYTTPEPDGQFLYKTEWNGSQITLLGAVNRASYALNRGLDNQDKGWIGNDA